MKSSNEGSGTRNMNEYCAFDNVKIDPALYGVWKGKKVCWSCFEALVRILRGDC